MTEAEQERARVARWLRTLRGMALILGGPIFTVPMIVKHTQSGAHLPKEEG